jgi:hypothetical protein
MKLPKFISSFLVMFVVVGLAGMQQAVADIILHPLHGSFKAVGSGNVTPQTPTINVLTVNPILTVDGVTGAFTPFAGLQATDTLGNPDSFSAPIRWEGSGSSAVLLDAPSGTGPFFDVINFSTGSFFVFQLNSLNFADLSSTNLTLRGIASSSVFTGSPVTDQFSGSGSFKITGTGQDFSFTNLTVSFSTPEGGSTLGFLAVGLFSLVAVEGLRRKIGTRQNRYT